MAELIVAFAGAWTALNLFHHVREVIAEIELQEHAKRQADMTAALELGYAMAVQDNAGKIVAKCAKCDEEHEDHPVSAPSSPSSSGSGPITQSLDLASVSGFNTEEEDDE